MIDRHDPDGGSATTEGTVRAALLLGLAVAGVCLTFVHSTRSDAYWTGDCANKALVSARLLDSFYRDPNFDYPAADVDPAWVAFPLPQLGIPRDGGLVSVFPLAYPALAAPFLAALGPVGLRWPAALGTGACAALFAIWLAPAVGRRLALAGGAALGLATPLFFYGVTVWELSLTLALAITASIAAARPGLAAAFGAGFAVGAACWLREELLLFGLALAAADAFRQRDLRRTLALLGGVALPGVALLGFNSAVYSDVLGPHAAQALALSATDLSGLATRLASLLIGRGSGPGEAIGLAALAVIVVLSPAIAAWRGRGFAAATALAAAIGLGLWAFGLIRIVAGPPLVGLVAQNGLFVQVPLASLAGAGLICAFRNEAARSVRTGVAAGLGFFGLATVAGLATHDVFGMGLHFGPRKLMPALPALIALVTLATAALGDAPGRVVVRCAAALLVIAGLGSSGLAGYLLHHQKAEGAALQDTLRARSEPYAISGDAMLTQALTGIWHDLPLLYAPRSEVLRQVVHNLRERGVSRVLVLAAAATPLRDPELALRCRALPHHRGGVVGYWDTDLLSCALRGRAR